MASRATPAEIDDAAADWIWRLDREGRTPELEAELASWRAQDSRHEGALLRAEAVWLTLDQTLRVTPLRPARSRSAPLLKRRGVLLGAGSSLAAGFAALYFGLGTRYDTTLGEIRRVPLKDGSTAAINTASAVDIAFTPKVRRVKLLRGEAWFQVAKNAEVPFVVEAGRARVQAVGTAFAVRALGQGAEVLVSEGVVEAWVEGARDKAIRIAAGGRAVIADNAVQAVASGPSEVDRALAWRDGKIDLAGETLAAAVTEFNRYNSRRIVVSDPELAEQRLYGVFRTDDPVGFSRSVAASLRASVASPDAQTIEIRKRGT